MKTTATMVVATVAMDAAMAVHVVAMSMLTAVATPKTMVRTNISLKTGSMLLLLQTSLRARLPMELHLSGVASANIGQKATTLTHTASSMKPTCALSLTHQFGALELTQHCLSMTCGHSWVPWSWASSAASWQVASGSMLWDHILHQGMAVDHGANPVAGYVVNHHVPLPLWTPPPPPLWLSRVPLLCKATPSPLLPSQVPHWKYPRSWSPSHVPNPSMLHGSLSFARHPPTFNWPSCCSWRHFALRSFASSNVLKTEDMLQFDLVKRAISGAMTRSPPCTEPTTTARNGTVTLTMDHGMNKQSPPATATIVALSARNMHWRVPKIIIQVHMPTTGPNVHDINPALYHATILSPSQFCSALPNESTFLVIWDLGASILVSYDECNFVGPLKKPGFTMQLKGITRGLWIEGEGHVMWAMHDTDGMLWLIKIPAFYVPKCKVRLLSGMMSLLQMYKDEKIEINETKLTLSGIPSEPTKGTVITWVNPMNNLPTSLSYFYGDTIKATVALTTVISTVDEANSNLTEPELICWHCCLGHIGFWKVQFLMRMGVLSQSQNYHKLHMAACKIIHPPQCTACQFRKQKQHPSPGKQSSVVRDCDGVLKKDHLLPGQCMSVDHFVFNTKGWLYTSRGKMSPNDMYDGGCIYFDHASGYIHCEHQINLTTHETLQAKEHFEQMCCDYGVIPQTYMSDNGKPVVSRNYEQHLATFKQIQNFAGVGAHHHNGMAECAIQTIMSIARTMMLHATIHWPKHAETHHCGPWQSIMQSTYMITMFPMNSLVWHPSTSSLTLAGLRASSMTCMFGDALSTCLTAPLLMARSSHTGSLAHIIRSTWGTHLSIPALSPWS